MMTLQSPQSVTPPTLSDDECESLYACAHQFQQSTVHPEYGVCLRCGHLLYFVVDVLMVDWRGVEVKGVS